MNAPDEHWLLVKNLWLPIENTLDKIGAVGDDAREKIDSLAGRLSSSLIDQLHYLRMERNALIHKNKPLSDLTHWRTTALSVHEAIQQNDAAYITEPSPEGSFKDLFVLLLGLAVWGVGSWYLKEFCNYLFIQVNQFSLTWWAIGTVWLLCWPGIIVAGLVGVVAGLVGGILGGLAYGLYWLLTYFIANPF